MSEVAIPFPLFSDLSGGLLEGGYLYFGQPNQDPEAAPIAVYWDAAMSIPAVQPLRTTAGLVVRDGTPAQVYAPEAYSLRVRQRDGSTVYYIAEAIIGSGGDDAALRADLADPTADTKGANLVAFAIGKSAQQKLTEEFSLNDIPIGNYADDNGRLLEAQMDGRRRIKLLTNAGLDGDWVIQASPWQYPLPPAGSPIDAYTEAAGNIFDGLQLYGEGPQTVINQADGNYALTCFPLSSDPANHISFAVRNLTIKSDDTKPYQEPVHQVAIHRFQEAKFENVRFIGSRSDGIWASMGPKQGTTAQNGLLDIRGCLFDGVDNNNRNAVSPECVADFVFIGNTVRHFTSQNNPGGIDFEPRDNTAYRTKNARIIGNLFELGGGSPVCFYLNAPDYYSTELGSMTFAYNDVSDYQYSMDMSGGLTSEIRNAYRRHDIDLSHNTFRRCGRGRVAGMFGVDITRNRFIDCDTIYLGSELNKGNREVRIEDNRMIRHGRLSRAAVIQDDETINCAVKRNFLWDVGHSDGGAGYGFLQRIGAMDVAVEDNEVVNPTGRMKQFAAKATSDAYGANASNRGNTVAPTALTTPDNYKPVAPAKGFRFTYTLSSDTTISYGGSKNFDATVPGAFANQQFDVQVLESGAWSAGDTIMPAAFGTGVNTVRIILFAPNPGDGAATATVLSAGTKVILTEKQ